MLNKKTKYLFLFILIILVTLNLIFPNQSDDITHYFTALDPNKSFFSSYLGLNGRFGELIWTGYLARFVDTISMDLINALIGTIFIFAFFFLIFARLPNSPKDFLTLAFASLILTNNYNFYEVFLWLSGSANYLWGMGLIILFLTPYRLLWQKIYQKTNIYNLNFNSKTLGLSLGLCVLAIPAGWASEHIGALVCFLLTISLAYAYYQKIKLPLWYYVGTIGFWSGWLILFSSPGSTRRATLITKNDFFISIPQIFHLSFMEKLQLINGAFNNHSFSETFVMFLGIFLFFYAYKMRCKLWQWLVLGIIFIVSIMLKFVASILVFALVLWLMTNMVKKLGREYLIYIALFSLWLLVAMILIQFKHGIPSRGRFGNNLILISICILMFRDFYTQYIVTTTNKFIKKHLNFIIYIIFALNLSYHFIGWGYLRYNWYQAEQLIYTQKSQGIEDIVLPKELFPNNSPDGWLNENYSRYYHVKSITVK